MRREFKEATGGAMSREEVTASMQRAMVAKMGAGANYEDDRTVAQWLEGDRANMQQRVAAALRATKVAALTRELSELDPVARREVMANLIAP